MSSPHIVKIFVPMRLVLGIGAALGGAAVVALALVAGLGLRLALVGVVVSVAGVAIAASSKVEGCAGCKTPFTSNHTDFRIGDLPYVVGALGAAAAGNAGSLGALASLPHQAPTERVTATLDLSYCPSCSVLGRAFTAERHFQGDGSSTLQKTAPTIELQGPVVKMLLDVLGARNTALQTTFYGGRAG
jgi:hypothetical protein